MAGSVYVSYPAQPVVSGSTTTYPGPLSVPFGQVDSYVQPVPSQINTETLYWADDFTNFYSTGSIYWWNGNTQTGPATAFASYLSAGNIGLAEVYTNSATQGGNLTNRSTVPLVKSSAVTMQWRSMFLLPQLSTSTNRFTIYIGGDSSTANGTNAYAPAQGPSIKYCDNVNSGNWVLESGIGGTMTTTNSSVAATAGWHTLTITLNNGVYTFVLDGVTLGTVSDANMPTTVNAGNAMAALFSMVIVPDGTDYTTVSYLVADRADFYATGLSR